MSYKDGYDWCARIPGRPGFFAIACERDDLPREHGAEYVRRPVSEAVDGHMEYLRWMDEEARRRVKRLVPASGCFVIELGEEVTP